MPGGASLTIVNVGYRSTNFWVVSAGTSRLLVDLGWPGRVDELLANLKRMDIPLGEIRYGLATHFHIDHAGAAQDLKRRGVPLLVMQQQVHAIPLMRQHIKPADHYTEITTHDNVVITTGESRTLLSRLGIPGEIVPTPGHSDDSVSLVLDNGVAFTGDLTMESMVATEDPGVVARSWQSLRDRGVTVIHPGHGSPYYLPPPGGAGSPRGVTQ
jgi:glyoxylase-like metal-dependent hydrolase (beta-lactamase superfamily II)